MRLDNYTPQACGMFGQMLHARFVFPGSDIFSGGGGGGSSVAQVPALIPEQRELLELINSFLSGQFQGGQLQGVTPFQGIRPGEVPFGPLQQQGFGLAGGLAPGIGAGIDLFGQTLGQFDPTQARGFLGTSQDALRRGLGFDPTQDILKAFEPSRRLATESFQRNIVPNLLERFGATSGPSGALNQALAEAGANLELGLSAQTAPFIGQAALAQPGLQLQGAGLGGNLAQLPGLLAQQGTQLGAQGVDLLSQLFNIGALQQQLPAGQAAAEQARFQEAQPQANPLLAQLGPLALGTSAFTNVVQPQGQGLLSSLLPSIGAFAGAGGFNNILGGLGGSSAAPVGFGTAGGALPASMLQAGQLAFMSDRRHKENVKPIDNALDKIRQLSGSTYNYKFNKPDNRNGGIMAQDLEKVLPDAVSEINGIKYVRYDAVIGLLVNAVNELARKVA